MACQKVPTLSLFGTADRYIDTSAAKLDHEYFEDHTEELFEGVSHWICVEAPERVNRAVEEYLRERGL